MAEQAGENPIVRWLGILTGIVLGLAALIAAIQHFAKVVRPEPEKPAPVLAPTDSPPIKGSGHTVNDVCDAQRQSYATQYPDFEISIDQSIQPSSDKDLLGTVTYVFHCHFTATRKSK